MATAKQYCEKFFLHCKAENCVATWAVGCWESVLQYTMLYCRLVELAERQNCIAIQFRVLWLEGLQEEICVAIQNCIATGRQAAGALGAQGRADGRTERARHGRPRRGLGAGWMRRLGQFWCTVHLAQFWLGFWTRFDSVFS